MLIFELGLLSLWSFCACSSVFTWVSSGFSAFLAGRQIVYKNCPLGVNECLNIGVHDVQ